MLNIQPINKKYNSIVSRYLKADRKMNDLIDQDKDETAQGFNTFDKCIDLWCELPKREQQNIEKQYYAFYGYYPQASVK